MMTSVSFARRWSQEGLQRWSIGKVQFDAIARFPNLIAVVEDSGADLAEPITVYTP
jgi:hypothetical protein